MERRFEQPQLNLFTLSFVDRDKTLEKPFLEHYFSDNLVHLRLCHLYTILFYAASGLIDFFLFSDLFLTFAYIRYGIVVPVFLIGFFSSFTDLYKKYWQIISFVYILLTGSSFILFSVMAPGSFGYEYWVGLFFCLMFGYTFIRERFIYATVAGTTLFVLCLLVFYLKDAPTQILLQCSIYLTFANLLGMLIARTTEISARKDYFLETKLSQEKEKVDQLNDQLELRVQKRTRELETINNKLSEKIQALKDSEQERSRLELQLRQAYKMEAIGTLAGGIAHDFNNILASIMGFTELALDEASEGSRQQDSLQEVYIAAKRATELVKQILTFARQSDEEPRPVNVSSLIKEVVKLLRSTIPSNISINCRIKTDGHVLGDPVNLHQILMNLATNASHAMPDGGVLTISLDEKRITSNSKKSVGKLKPGEFLRIAVGDTGTGIPSEHMESIFEPYFTTKEGSQGTGMGLAVVYGIVTKYKGDIQVESTEGQGSCFTVLLPKTNGNIQETPYRSREFPTGHEHILFIDDEYPIAKMASIMLEKQGYTVTVKTDSSEAFKKFQNNPNQFDLVISDTMMPGLTGDKLAEKILQIRPDLPVILCTGYSQRINEQSAKQSGIQALVDKPIIKEQLLTIIRDVLDKKSC